MDEQKQGSVSKQSGGSISVRFMYLRVGLFAVAVICSMGYIFTTGSRMAAKHAPLVDAAMEIKLQAAQAHLWFEEMISGDRTVDIDQVWELQDKANYRAEVQSDARCYARFYR